MLSHKRMRCCNKNGFAQLRNLDTAAGATAKWCTVFGMIAMIRMLSPGQHGCVAVVATLGTIVAGKATEHQHIQGQYSGNPFHVANLQATNYSNAKQYKNIIATLFYLWGGEVAVPFLDLFVP